MSCKAFLTGSSKGLKVSEAVCSFGCLQKIFGVHVFEELAVAFDALVCAGLEF